MTRSFSTCPNRRLGHPGRRAEHPRGQDKGLSEAKEARRSCHEETWQFTSGALPGFPFPYPSHRQPQSLLKSASTWASKPRPDPCAKKCLETSLPRCVEEDAQGRREGALSEPQTPAVTGRQVDPRDPDNRPLLACSPQELCFLPLTLTNPDTSLPPSCPWVSLIEFVGQESPAVPIVNSTSAWGRCLLATIPSEAAQHTPVYPPSARPISWCKLVVGTVFVLIFPF